MQQIRRAWQQKTSECPYCDETGFLEYVHGSTASGATRTACPHDREQIERWAQHHGYAVPMLRNPRSS